MEMFFTIIVISAIVIIFLMLALGTKSWLKNKNDIIVPTCEIKDNQSVENEACLDCKIKEIVDCSKEA